MLSTGLHLTPESTEARRRRRGEERRARVPRDVAAGGARAVYRI